ncbi:RNA 2',3'-cyclic phosphodiesterase [Sphingomonas naphthae]|uniref:RNA 2',3'-cyclic phosphodiesterase n=1 Tax=Sphingomonas naphthae TaxID=1813468 RepID=A0ABY7TI63_9SPHN|nr:RNA 2',3'-cyclic phosphodiesterase [Sphingomonas naphthae]WCT72917.1 RNA 2',3'-cyclic phosphodiesterase [Sphingomonas naphthae]
MHRLFVALRPPPPMRVQLVGLMGGGSGLRWQGDEQLHLTLRFIGEVDHHQAEDIAAALGSIHAPPVTFALRGAGLLDRRGVPDTLWAGVTPHDGLRLLAERIGQALRRVGVPIESRAFLPHITVARLSRHAGPIDDILARWSSLASSPVTVAHFGLYESSLGGEGARYEAIARYPLAST